MNVFLHIDKKGFDIVTKKHIIQSKSLSLQMVILGEGVNFKKRSYINKIEGSSLQTATVPNV